mmetsp:Transcript_18353/g.36691  ORF Transcript_18353/g.36691 Transcript_18353/m.36691 type:complete len:304 (-) Transcript_18353:65-976(-)
MTTAVQRASCAAILVVLIVSAFLLGFSFYVIEPNNVAIDYNKVSQRLDTAKLYDPGRIFLGVGHEMIVFPTIQQTRDLGTLTGRSKDGLSVQFRCNYQYLYTRTVDSLSKMYLDYKGTHEKVFDFYAASVLRDTMATYTAFEVITKRPLLSADMFESVKAELANYGVEVTALQLLNTELPDRFVNAIEQTVITQQNMEKASFTLEKAKINGDTKRLTAAIDAKLILVTAEAEATAKLNEAKAEASAKTVQLASEKDAYSALYTKINGELGGFGKDHLLAYMRTESLADTSAGGINFGIDQKIV